MPPKRLPKCSYYEGNRKCGANSTPGTNPPLCRAHQAILAATAERRSQHPVVGGLEDLFGAWSRGDEINVNDVIRTGAEALGSLFQGRRMPDMPDMPRMPPMPDMPPSRPWSGAWSGDQDRPQPPPRQAPPGPGLEEIRRARQTLHILPAEKLTSELLKVRYRKLAVKHHPDRGGSTRKIAEINAARDVLEATFQRQR